jgi:hypothetical protein
VRASPDTAGLPALEGDAQPAACAGGDGVMRGGCALLSHALAAGYSVVSDLALLSTYLITPQTDPVVVCIV